MVLYRYIQLKIIYIVIYCKVSPTIGLLAFYCVLELKEHNEKSKEISILPSEVAHNDDNHEESSLHSMIGLALVLGFVFMLLVDQIGSSSRSARGAFQFS